jgi:hypothetical protein
MSSFRIHQKGVTAMADEKEKAIEKEQEIIKPTAGKKPEDQLSEEDLKKLTGGAHIKLAA